MPHVPLLIGIHFQEALASHRADVAADAQRYLLHRARVANLFHRGQGTLKTQLQVGHVHTRVDRVVVMTDIGGLLCYH